MEFIDEILRADQLAPVVAARVGYHRNDCGHDVCGQPAGHVRASSRITGGLVERYT
jgi:hypothetical protein